MTSARLPNGPVYAVTTPHLTLRCVDPADARAFHAIVAKNRQRIARWRNPSEFDTLGDVAAWLRQARALFDLGQAFAFAMILHGESEPLGFVALDPRLPDGGFEIHGWIDADQSGRGLADEMGNSMMKIAFELYGARRVEMLSDPDNPSVKQLAPRLGFRAEATLRRRVVVEGELRDRTLWTVHDCDYPGTPASAFEMIAYDVLGEVVLATDPAPRPPAGSVWGRDAVTWSAAKQHLVARYRVVEASDITVTIAVKLSHRAGTVEQRIRVELGQVLDEPVVVFAAAVAPEAELGTGEALAHNATLAVGALCLVGEEYELRHGVALAALSGRELDRVITLVGHEAARLQVRRLGGSDAAVYAWFADGDSPAPSK